MSEKDFKQCYDVLFKSIKYLSDLHRCFIQAR